MAKGKTRTKGMKNGKKSASGSIRLAILCTLGLIVVSSLLIPSFGPGGRGGMGG